MIYALFDLVAILFDVVAACVYPPTRQWAFRYRATTSLTPHAQHAGRVAALQKIDQAWATDLEHAQ